MTSKILPYIPKHTVYAEPFCGGATVMFKKPWPELVKLCESGKYGCFEGRLGEGLSK